MIVQREGHCDDLFRFATDNRDRFCRAAHRQENCRRKSTNWLVSQSDPRALYLVLTEHEPNRKLLNASLHDSRHFGLKRRLETLKAIAESPKSSPSQRMAAMDRIWEMIGMAARALPEFREWSERNNRSHSSAQSVTTKAYEDPILLKLRGKGVQAR